jgi:hypothetical protein
MREWLGAIGDCGLALTRGVPILSSFYGAYRRNGTTRTKFGEQLLMHSGARVLGLGIDRVEETISPEARYGVWKAWGILPDHQVALEQMYAGMHVDYSDDRVSDYTEMPNPLLL